MTIERTDPTRSVAAPAGQGEWHDSCKDGAADQSPGADRPWTVSADAVHFSFPIDLTRDGAVATLWLARGAARNALSTAGWLSFAAKVAELATSDFRAVILASREPSIFCAGADIGEFAELQRDGVRRAAFRDALFAGIEGIAQLPMPVVAAVDGGCFGAAVGLVLACDMIVAGDDARFAVPPARLGILYPPSDIARLVAAVGRGQAARLMFTADTITADEAQAIGLTTVRAPDALSAACAIADRIAGNAPRAVRGLKRGLDAAPDGIARFDAAFDDNELIEGLAAFRDRRSPRFA